MRQSSLTTPSCPVSSPSNLRTSTVGAGSRSSRARSASLRLGASSSFRGADTGEVIEADPELFWQGIYLWFRSHGVDYDTPMKRSNSLIED